MQGDHPPPTPTKTGARPTHSLLTREHCTCLPLDGRQKVRIGTSSSELLLAQTFQPITRQFMHAGERYGNRRNNVCAARRTVHRHSGEQLNYQLHKKAS
jgi:hypothetical protein